MKFVKKAEPITGNMSDVHDFFEEMIDYHSQEGHKEKTQIYKDIRVALFGNDYLEENYNGHTRQ